MERTNRGTARRDAEPAALPRREPPVPVVAAELRAVLVHDVSRLRHEPLALEEAPVVVTGEEAGLLALGSPRRCETGRARLGARLLLRLLAERELDAIEQLGAHRREHVRLILQRIPAAGNEPLPVPLDDARVVAGPELLGACSGGELEQRVEPERAVAAAARVRRLPRPVRVHERRDHLRPELLAQVERHVRQAEGVAGGPGRRDRGGRAARALGAWAGRVLPEPERDADRVRPCAVQRNRAVHAPAHRHRDTPGRGLRLEDLAERRGERLDRERLGRRRGPPRAGVSPASGRSRPSASLSTMRSPSRASRIPAQSPFRVASPKTSRGTGSG